MTKENKNILFNYLSMALPYGVKVLNTAEDLNEICELDSIMTSRKHDKVFVGLTLPDDAIMTGIEMVKPYLRSMSSMTEEEFLEYHNIKYNKVTYRRNYGRFDVGKYRNVGIIPIKDYLVWLLKNHFDFMDLIPQGIAIEVTEENNPYKE